MPTMQRMSTGSWQKQELCNVRREEDSSQRHVIRIISCLKVIASQSVEVDAAQLKNFPPLIPSS